MPYPEGVAAAEILKAGNDKSGITDIATGGLLAGAVAFATNGLRLIADGASHWFKAGSAVFQLPMGFSLALLGAGYLVGIVGGIAILTGIAIAWWAAVPYFSAAAPAPADMETAAYAMKIWKEKVRFIGVGTIGIAALWTLLTLMKPMAEGMRQSLQALKNPHLSASARTEQDLKPQTMIYITLATIAVIAATVYGFVQSTPLDAGTTALLVIVCTFLAVAIGFFVAAACGYMAGLVGSSSSPISGIGIISVVLISLTLLLVGSVSGLSDNPEGVRFLTALTIFSASIVLAVATISNDNLQDLKTGLLVKATPWRQQIALLIGCVVGAAVIAPVLEMLYHAYGFTGAMPRANMDAAQALAAPQATLMTTIAQGIFSDNLEWGYIFSGIGLGIVLIIIDTLLKRSSKGRFALPALAVGMGIYLPPAINAPLVIGTLLSWFIARHLHRHAKNSGRDPETVLKSAERKGTLFAAGLIVGESLIGVVLAFIIVASVTSGGSDAPLALALPDNWHAEALGLLVFIIGAAIFAWRILQAKREP